MRNTGKEKIQNKITFIDNIYVTIIKRNVTKIKENCDNEEDIFRFIEQFCYLKDKKDNIYKPIKLSNLQKEFINYYGTISNQRTCNKRK